MNDYEPILKEYDGPQGAKSNAQIPLALNMNSGKVISPPSRFNPFSPPCRYYVVNNGQDPSQRRSDSVSLELSNIEDGLPPIRLRLEFEAWCQPGHEVLFVESVGMVDEVAEAIHRHLQFYATEFYKHRSATFIGEFEANIKALRQNLRQRCQQELGLSLALRIGLDSQLQDSIRLEDETIHVRPKGMSPGLELRLDVEFALDRTLRNRALHDVLRGIDLEAQAIRWVQAFFEEQVSLHHFHYALRSRVHGRLQSYLEEKARARGRKLTRLVIASKEPLPRVPRSHAADYKFQCRLEGYPEPVGISSRIEMELADVGAYIERGEPNLKAWAEERVSSVTSSLLFESRYSGLIRNYEDKKAEIKQRMKAEAKQIGYSLRQMLTFTDLQIEALQRPFELKQDFDMPTATPYVRANLEVVVRCRFGSITKVANLLDRRLDVQKEMCLRIEQVISDIMSQTQPETFYLYFTVAEPSHDNASQWERRRQGVSEPEVMDRHGETLKGKKSLSQRMSMALQGALTTEFGNEVLSIRLRQKDSEIGQLLRKLMSEFRTFQVHPVPRGADDLPFPFEGDLCISGVDPIGWQNFVHRKPTIEGVTKALKRAIESRLSGASADELWSLSPEEMRQQLNAWCAQHFGELFGLSIRILNWRRLPRFDDLERQKTRRREIAAAGQADRSRIAEMVEKDRTARDFRQKGWRQLLEEASQLRQILVDDHAGLQEEERQDILERLAEIEAEVSDLEKETKKEALTLKGGKAQRTWSRELDGKPTYQSLRGANAHRGQWSDGGDRHNGEDIDSGAY